MPPRVPSRPHARRRFSGRDPEEDNRAATPLEPLYSMLMRTADPFHLGLVAATAAMVVLSVLLAAAGVSIATSLLVLMLAPAVTVVGYEKPGYRHIADALDRL